MKRQSRDGDYIILFYFTYYIIFTDFINGKDRYKLDDDDQIYIVSFIDNYYLDDRL